jgi:hypothetical protein
VTKNNILNRKAGPSGSESIDMPAAFGWRILSWYWINVICKPVKGNVVASAGYWKSIAVRVVSLCIKLPVIIFFKTTLFYAREILFVIFTKPYYSLLFWKMWNQ